MLCAVQATLELSSMVNPEKDRVRRYHRAKIAAVQAMFEGYLTVQRGKLALPDCELTPKQRAALAKKLDKQEASMAKSFQRTIKELEK
jgi:hypothetical protein